jgi:hypothetical protein
MTLLNNPPRDALLAAFEAILPIARVHVSDNYQYRAVLFVNTREESLCVVTDIETAERVRERFGDMVVKVKK